MNIINAKHMITISRALTLIKNAEGFSSTVYTDTTGHKTIGYGFNMEAMGITQETMTIFEAQDILEKKVLEIRQQIFLPEDSFEKFTMNEKAVMLDMAYNLGVAEFFKFDNFLKYINQGNYEYAATDLTNTLWYKQVGQRAVRDILNLCMNDKYLILI
ncbi:MAG: hypothetical protein M0016_00015 [Deltaproteobacteria bacterium]|jgi:lysozyme|nr:hypothetical protein [Deltaproteobacteria bacterium]